MQERPNKKTKYAKPSSSGIFVRNLVIALSVLLLLMAGACGRQKDAGAGMQPEQPGQVEQTRQDTDAASKPLKENTQKASATDQVQQTADDSKSRPAAPAISAEKVKEAEIVYEQGFQTFLGGKYDEAIKLFNRAIELDPYCYKAYNGKGIALSFQGNYKDGMELIKKALELKPDFPYANFNMALAYKLQKDYNQALVWFDKAISYNPGDTWSYFGKACIYAEWNDAAKAVENLRKAIETDPGVKDVARREHDLDNIRSNPEFLKLVN